jgi:hypothetical protein
MALPPCNTEGLRSYVGLIPKWREQRPESRFLKLEIFSDQDLLRDFFNLS